jgi:alpha-beta hydrolase superfamily lysophospholipase
LLFSFMPAALGARPQSCAGLSYCFGGAKLEKPEATTFTLTLKEGTQLFVYRWAQPKAKASVQIVHGLAEHAARYGRLAEALNAAGYAVYASDLRGHGRTVRNPDELGLLADCDGWRTCLNDLWSVNRRIAQEQPGMPIFVLGHSMGSSLALQMMCERGDSLAGVVLSAASGKPTAVATVGRMIARIERLRLGRRGKSRLVQSLTFDSFNQRFEPARTRFDWLSRDPAEVDKYVADPLCGFQAPVQLWIDLLDGWTRAASPESWRQIPKRLPIYVISGTHDPVSAGTRQVRPMLEEWRAAGLNVQHRFYPEARHELFNETNRDEVTSDLVGWLEKALNG